MVLSIRTTLKPIGGLFAAGGDISVNIRRFGNKLTAKEREAIFMWANTVKKEGKLNLEDSKSTGKLQRSWGENSNDGIFKVSEKDFSVTVGTRVSYAPHVNYGTRRHLITAKKGKYLKFISTRGLTHSVTGVELSVPGETVYRKRVVHPGTQGKYFIDKAVNRANEVVIIKLKEPINL